MNHWMDLQAAASLEHVAELHRQAAQDRRAAAPDTRAFAAVKRLIAAAVRRPGFDAVPASAAVYPIEPRRLAHTASHR